MDKKGNTKISLAFDISGIVLIIVAIVIVKLATNPLVEIIAGILATIGFGLVAGAKYVWNNKCPDIGFNTGSNYTSYIWQEENINIFFIGSF